MAAMGINSIPGSLNVNVKATVLDKYLTKQSPAIFDIPIEWKGSLGPTLSGTQGGAYDYRLYSTLTYSNVRYPWNVSLAWRYLPSVWGAGHAAEQARIANNNAVVDGDKVGMIIKYTPGTEIKTPSYNIFDLSGSWEINETWSVRLGVNNVFQNDPPTSGNTAGRDPATAGALADVCSAEQEARGCSDPSAYSPSSIGGFNAGYYDTVGRRFFMGVKAKF
jgi:iron complex outermembrane recepter protein